MRGKFLLRSDFERYFLVFLIVVTPLYPLVSVLASAYLLFLLRRRDVFHSVLLGASIGLGLAGLGRASMIILIINLLLDTVFSKRYLFFLGTILSSLVTYYVLGYTSSVQGYIGCLAKYVSQGQYELMGVHIVLLFVVLVLTIFKHPWFHGSRIARYFNENQQAFPAILFMALLVAAAIYLAVGNEVLANKLAELGYYSLVIAVSLALTGLRESSPGEAEAGDKT